MNVTEVTSSSADTMVTAAVADSVSVSMVSAAEAVKMVPRVLVLTVATCAITATVISSEESAMLSAILSSSPNANVATPPATLALAPVARAWPAMPVPIATTYELTIASPGGNVTAINAPALSSARVAVMW